MGLYFAYGSNLHVGQMRLRCPAAVPLARYRLRNWRLVFRGVADCIAEEGAVCYGGVWRITPACERALDIYEGVESGLYRKEYLPIKPTPEGDTDILLYVMNSTGIMPPSQHYLSIIRQGYRYFSMPPRARTLLNQAVRESWDDKAPSYRERWRYRRTGRPPLAARPGAPAMPATGQQITLAIKE
jgi:hypothetical protein